MYPFILFADEPILEDENQSLHEEYDQEVSDEQDTDHEVNNDHLEDNDEDQPKEDVNQQDDDILDKSDSNGHTNTR